jgi:hypothetical protein
MEPKTLVDTIVTMLNDTVVPLAAAAADVSVNAVIKDSKGFLYSVRILWSEEYQVLGLESPPGESPKLADMEFHELHRSFLQLIEDPPRELTKNVRRVILSSRDLTVEKFYENGWRLNSQLDLELN